MDFRLREKAAAQFFSQEKDPDQRLLEMPRDGEISPEIVHALFQPRQLRFYLRAVFKKLRIFQEGMDPVPGDARTVRCRLFIHNLKPTDQRMV